MRGFLRPLNWLRESFVTGLLVALPIGLTAVVIWLLYRFIYHLFGPETPFARLLIRAFGRYIPGVELIITFVIVIAVGALSRLWLGRKLHNWLERLLLSVPGLRKVYWAMRQLVHALFQRNSTKLRRVVLFEYPREGMYVLGFVTEDDVGQIDRIVGKDCVSVYAPTAPNPLSGWVFFIPKDEIIELDMPVDEGLSLILSGGIVFPESLKRGRDADLEGRKEE
ncbi:MAG: DUF502 domain-containing protein [Caldiserica bacterium]|nr:DUF502 domain-containing protein [Caldisericota bacterium]